MPTKHVRPVALVAGLTVHVFYTVPAHPPNLFSLEFFSAASAEEPLFPVPL